MPVPVSKTEIEFKKEETIISLPCKYAKAKYLCFEKIGELIVSVPIDKKTNFSAKVLKKPMVQQTKRVSRLEGIFEDNESIKS